MKRRRVLEAALALVAAAVVVVVGYLYYVSSTGVVVSFADAGVGDLEVGEPSLEEAVRLASTHIGGNRTAILDEGLDLVESLTFRFAFTVRNPGPVSVRVSRLTWTLRIDNVTVAEVVTDADIDVGPGSVQVVRTNETVGLGEYPFVAEALLEGNGRVDLEVEGGVEGSVLFVPFRTDFQGSEVLFARSVVTTRLSGVAVGFFRGVKETPGSLHVVESFWTQNGTRVSEVEPGTNVTGHLVLRADGVVITSAELSAYLDISQGEDRLIVTEVHRLAMRSGETAELTVRITTQGFRSALGNYLTAEWHGESWTQEGYPPRLSTNRGG